MASQFTLDPISRKSESGLNPNPFKDPIKSGSELVKGVV